MRFHRSRLIPLIALALALFGTPPASAVVPVVTTYSYPFVGSTTTASTMTGWTTLAGSTNAGAITANVDDAVSGNLLPSGFTIKYNGTTYNYLIISSNSVLCFTTCGTAYQNFSGAVPGGPNIQICSADYNALAIYTLYDSTTSTFKIRYEGHQHSKANDAVVADIWEATFHNGSNIFELGVGNSDICSSTNGSPYSPASGFADGTNYLGYFITNGSDNLANKGFQILTGSLAASTVSLSQPGSNLTFRTGTTIQATVNTPGKVTFYQQGKPIPGCRSIAAVVSGPNYIANCNFKPSIHGAANIKATFVPSSAAYTGSTSAAIQIVTDSRSTLR